ncbi:MAG: hypothetical protein ACK4VV_07420 [Pseudomonas sp.]
MLLLLARRLVLPIVAAAVLCGIISWAGPLVLPRASVTGLLACPLTWRLVFRLVMALAALLLMFRLMFLWMLMLVWGLIGTVYNRMDRADHSGVMLRLAYHIDL